MRGVLRELAHAVLRQVRLQFLDYTRHQLDIPVQLTQHERAFKPGNDEVGQAQGIGSDPQRALRPGAPQRLLDRGAQLTERLAQPPPAFFTPAGVHRPHQLPALSVALAAFVAGADY